MRTRVAFSSLLALAGLALSSTVSTRAYAADDTAPAPAPAPADGPATTVTTTTTTTTGTGTSTDKVAPGTVLVHLDSPQTVNLEHRQGIGNSSNPWQYVCTSPCDTAVLSGDEFRVTGPDINSSRSFQLKSGDGQKVTLQVVPGKPGKATAGYVLIGTGAALAVAGVLVIAIGSRGGDTFPGGEGGSDTSTTNNKNFNIILTGTGLILGGVVAGVLGGSFVIDNAHTRVGAGEAPPSGEKGTSPTTPTENPSDHGSSIVSSNHIPYFVDTQAHKLAGSIPTYTVPLFTKSF
jgi:hypothetical protein